MRFLLLINFILFPYFSYGNLNGTYLFCELTPEFSFKEKEVENQNYVFFFFNKHEYDQKKIVKNIFVNTTNFTLKTFNQGKYNFEDNKINLVDNLIFREKRLKSVLNRNTMILKSNYKDKLLFEYFCELSDLKKNKEKSFEIVKKLKKFWKNKFKDNKI